MRVSLDRRRLAKARSFVLLALLLFAGCTTLKRCAYEGLGRDEWQKPDRVVLALKIKPGDRVADLGSGGGYFTFRLAEAVGPGGQVYAVDVDEGLVDYIRNRAKEEKRANVKAVLAKHNDPLLPLEGVDLIFTSNTYHHLENRAAYFANAKQYLSETGRVAIIDFNEKGWLKGLSSHHTPKEVIKKEMEQAGYRLEREFDFLPKQNFLIFSKG